MQNTPIFFDLSLKISDFFFFFLFRPCSVGWLSLGCVVHRLFVGCMLWCLQDYTEIQVSKHSLFYKDKAASTSVHRIQCTMPALISVSSLSIVSALIKFCYFMP